MLVEMDGPGADYAARRFGSLAPLADALVDDIDGVLVVLCSATACRRRAADDLELDAPGSPRRRTAV